MRAKGALYLIVAFIGIIILGVQFIINNLSGCTQELLSRFERLELAKTYEQESLASFKNVPAYLNNGKSYWEIEKQGNGCKVQFVVSYYLVKNYVYYGDEFFINLKDKTVYPISDGAKEYIEYYRFQTKIP